MAISNPLNPYDNDPAAPALAKIARPKQPVKSPALQQLGATMGAANQAGQNAADLQKKTMGIPLQAPVIREGRSSWSSTQTPAGAASVVATRTLGARANDQLREQHSFTPALRDLTSQVRQETAQVRAQTAQVGANKLLANLGAAPIAPTTVRPMAPPLARPPTAIAPRTPVNFAGVDPEPQGLTRNPAQPQASQSIAVAAPPPLRPGDLNTYTGGNGKTVAVPGMATAPVGTVPSQSFDNAPVVARPTSRMPGSPGVASTYGQSVISMPDDNVIAPAQSTGAFRGPQAMAEQYKSREDREARIKMSSDIDTQLFMLRGKNDPASLGAMTELSEQKARLASGGEALSAEATQGRAARENTLANTGLEQSGAMDRSQLDASVTRDGQQVTREGNALDYDANRAQTAASLIEKPNLIQDADGNYVKIGSNGIAAPILDGGGKPVRGKVQGQETPQLSPDAILKSFDGQERTLQELLFNAPPEEKPALLQRIDGINAQRVALLSGGATKVTTVAQLDALPKGARYLAPDGRIYVKE